MPDNTALASDVPASEGSATEESSEVNRATEPPRVGDAGPAGPNPSRASQPPQQQEDPSPESETGGESGAPDIVSDVDSDVDTADTAGGDGGGGMQQQKVQPQQTQPPDEQPAAQKQLPEQQMSQAALRTQAAVQALQEGDVSSERLEAFFERPGSLTGRQRRSIRESLQREAQQIVNPEQAVQRSIVQPTLGQQAGAAGGDGDQTVPGILRGGPLFTSATVSQLQERFGTEPAPGTQGVTRGDVLAASLNLPTPQTGEQREILEQLFTVRGFQQEGVTRAERVAAEVGQSEIAAAEQQTRLQQNLRERQQNITGAIERLQQTLETVQSSESGQFVVDGTSLSRQEAVSRIRQRIQNLQQRRRRLTQEFTGLVQTRKALRQKLQQFQSAVTQRGRLEGDTIERPFLRFAGDIGQTAFVSLTEIAGGDVVGTDPAEQTRMLVTESLPAVQQVSQDVVQQLETAVPDVVERSVVEATGEVGEVVGAGLFGRPRVGEAVFEKAVSLVPGALAREIPEKTTEGVLGLAFASEVVQNPGQVAERAKAGSIILASRAAQRPIEFGVGELGVDVGLDVLTGGGIATVTPQSEPLQQGQVPPTVEEIVTQQNLAENVGPETLEPRPTQPRQEPGQENVMQVSRVEERPKAGPSLAVDTRPRVFVEDMPVTETVETVQPAVPEIGVASVVGQVQTVPSDAEAVPQQDVASVPEQVSQVDAVPQLQTQTVAVPQVETVPQAVSEAVADVQAVSTTVEPQPEPQPQPTPFGLPEVDEQPGFTFRLPTGQQTGTDFPRAKPFISVLTASRVEEVGGLEQATTPRGEPVEQFRRVQQGAGPLARLPAVEELTTTDGGDTGGGERESGLNRDNSLNIRGFDSFV